MFDPMPDSLDAHVRPEHQIDACIAITLAFLVIGGGLVYVSDIGHSDQYVAEFFGGIGCFLLAIIAFVYAMCLARNYNYGCCFRRRQGYGAV